MHRSINPNQNKGFSLMEVLIAMLILGVGLLGVAALQTVALKTNHSAYQRTQATFLAYDMMDRMRANRTAAIAGDYNLAMGDDPSAGGTLAEQDLDDWVNNYVAQLLPAGDGSVNCTNAGVCTVIVQWDESRTGGAATDGGGDILQFSFTAEI
jgi:type IV pilus assembly protein PilV